VEKMAKIGGKLAYYFYNFSDQFKNDFNFLPIEFKNCCQLLPLFIPAYFFASSLTIFIAIKCENVYSL
jgi:hypothetical protein